MSNGEESVSRRSWTSLGNISSGGSFREEPFRNYGGWHCPRCNSTNTLIEEYDSGLEGYCMSCARTIEIPKEALDVYRNRSNIRQPQRTR